MTDPHYIGTILYVSLSIYAVLLAAGLLMQERRYSVKKTALLWGVEGLVLLLDMYLCFGLLPVSLRLPVSLTIGFFSYVGVFIAVSADGFWKKVYLLITFFCVCCISWSAGLYLCYFFLPDSSAAGSRCLFTYRTWISRRLTAMSRRATTVRAVSRHSRSIRCEAPIRACSSMLSGGLRR
mgnify:CR=1 FL=1